MRTKNACYSCTASLANLLPMTTRRFMQNMTFVGAALSVALWLWGQRVSKSETFDALFKCLTDARHCTYTIACAYIR